MQTTSQCNNSYRHREPPPYPGLGRPLYQTAGFRQSYSGSETSTDLSLSSSENLSSTVRQDPQGEETITTANSPLEPPRDRGPDCGGTYRSLSARSARGSEPGVEVKLTNSSTFYVTGNMPPPTTAVCSSSHGYHMVNSSHGNHAGSHDNPKFIVNNNNNNNNRNMRGGSISKGYAQCGDVLPMSPASTRVSQGKTLMSQYQSDAMRSLCQQLCSPQMLYPASPNSSPTIAKGTSPKGSSPQHSLSPSPVKQHPSMMRILNGKEAPVMSQGGSHVISTDSSHSLSQLMSALSRHSANQNNIAHVARERQRPSTAPSMRHLPTVPPPPQYPGYSTDPRQSPDFIEKLSLRRSQPDLTRLAELSIPSQQHDAVLPSGEPASRPSDLGINLERGRSNMMNGNNIMSNNDIINGNNIMNSNNNPNRTGGTNNANDANYAYQQIHQVSPLSSTTSSSPVALMKQQLAQLQNCHLQASGGTSRDLQLSAMVNPVSTALSSSLQNGHISSTVHPPGSATSSPDKVLADLQSPNLGKLSELDYAALTMPGNQLVDNAAMGARTQLVDHAAIATRATQMVERLSEENRSLRQELEGYYKKVYRLQKLELEIQKVHENYETLVKHSRKQQSLEKLIRCKLEAEIKKLRDTNKELKDQLDKALRQLQQKEIYAMLDSEIKNELLGKDSLIAKLISQNQDLTVTKEDLELEFITQKSAMHDQSVHLKLLESALSSTRGEVNKCEQQLHKRKSDEEKVSELQKALSQLQTAVEKREAIEQKLRQKLEEEVQCLKNQQKQSGMNKMTEADEGISSDSESPTSLQSLVRQMTEKEQRILSLEAEVAKWKQKYLEETALRQFAVDAACVPKDARIASLEQSSLETEKLIADARHDCHQQKDEVHTTNRRCAELEAKLKTIQAQLAEKDAMIRVFQRHIPISRTTNIASLLYSPLHSPRPSFNSTSTPLHSPRPSFLASSSPLASPLSSPLIPHSASSTPSGASSRQNSQFDTGSSFSSRSSNTAGNSTGGKDREGNPTVHSKSNSTSSTASSTSSTSDNPQLRELKQKLTAQAALFGSMQSGSDQLKKYMWQV